MQKIVDIRQATADDAGRIHEIHTQSVRTLCKGHYSSEQIAGWLKNRSPQGYLPGIGRGEMFVATDGISVLGFGQAIPGEIHAVYVAPEYAKQGVGILLLEQALTAARAGSQGDVYLEATLNAQGFYKKAGFVELERSTVRRNEVLLPVIEWFHPCKPPSTPRSFS